MLQGSHSITMDAKGRLAIPAELRDKLMAVCGGRVTVTAHTEDRCLLIYPESEWQKLAPKIQALPNIDPKARRMQRILLGNAKEFEIDEANGRILLPPTLRDYAGLEKKLMLLGQGHKIEIWSEERWEGYLDHEADDGETSDAVAAISL